MTTPKPLTEVLTPKQTQAIARAEKVLDRELAKLAKAKTWRGTQNAYFRVKDARRKLQEARESVGLDMPPIVLTAHR